MLNTKNSDEYYAYLDGKHIALSDLEASNFKFVSNLLKSRFYYIMAKQLHPNHENEFINGIKETLQNVRSSKN